jgi:DNA-binding transcriptional LysR family regulator
MKGIDYQLRLFLEIVRSKSLSRAADSLQLTQSALSRQLSSLEDYLGHRLFERTGRGVELTETGRKLKDATESAYELVDSAISRIRELEGVTEGSLTVATIHTLSYYFMADVVATFLAQRPKVNITLLGRSSTEVVELIESGKADIGFVYDTVVASDALNITPLFEETMSLIVHEDSPVAAHAHIDLQRLSLPLVVFPAHYALRRMLSGKGIDFKVAAEVETVDAMLKLVSITSGQCVLPDRIPTKLLREYRLVHVKIVSPLLRRRIVAITRHGRSPTTLSTLMLNIARSGSAVTDPSSVA